MKVFLQTARMQILRPASSDLDFFKKVYGDSEMMTHLGGAQSDALILQRFNASQSHWERFGHGYAIVRLKETGERVGIVSLVYEVVEGKNRPDLGCMILREYRQTGLALEATSAFMVYGFTTLGLDFITACHHQEHSASKRIVETLGFEFERLVQYSYGGKEFQFMSWIKRKGT